MKGREKTILTDIMCRYAVSMAQEKSSFGNVLRVKKVNVFRTGFTE